MGWRGGEAGSAPLRAMMWAGARGISLGEGRPGIEFFFGCVCGEQRAGCRTCEDGVVYLFRVSSVVPCHRLSSVTGDFKLRGRV